MIISKRALPRRTFLKGAGVALGLPLLDAMVPALTVTARTAAAPTPRLGFFYVPNGMSLPSWRPTTEGANFELPATLTPLLPYRDQVTMVSGLSNYSAMGGGLGVHSRPCGAFLSGVRPVASESSDVRLGVTADQLAARVLGKDTVFESLELSADSGDRVGNCEYQYSCLYISTISWRSATVPNPMEVNPRAAFERLFGEENAADARQRRLRMDKSILDALTSDFAAFRKKIGSSDGQLLGEYLDAVRSVELRIQKAEKRAATAPTIDRPMGVPDSFEEHVTLLTELMALAWQADLTRVSSFLMSREVSPRTYPEVGVHEQHHDVSHHQGRPDNLAKLATVNAFHMKLFASFIDKLKKTQDGDGTLLDHSLILYGGGISDSDLHSPLDLPLALVGGGWGTVKGNRHLKYAADRKIPMANLLRTILDKAGVPVDSLGDSSGELSEL